VVFSPADPGIFPIQEKERLVEMNEFLQSWLAKCPAPLGTRLMMKSTGSGPDNVMQLKVIVRKEMYGKAAKPSDG
jgi:hypothetical protein